MDFVESNEIHDEMVFSGGFSEDEFRKSVDEDDCAAAADLRSKVQDACRQLLGILGAVGKLSTAGMIVECSGRRFSVLVHRSTSRRPMMTDVVP